MEFVILFCAVLAGVVAGWFIREEYAKRVVNTYLADLRGKIEEDKENSIKVKLEKHKDHIYVFEDETDKFLGQAENLEELDKYMSTTYPGKRFLVRESNAESVGVKL